MLFIFMLGLSIVLSFSVVQCLLSQLHSTGTDNYPFAPHLASYTKFQCLWDIAFKCPAILTSGFIFFYSMWKLHEMKWNTIFGHVRFQGRFGLEEISLMGWAAFEYCSDVILNLDTLNLSEYLLYVW